MSLSNPPKKARAEQLQIIDAAEKRLKEVKDAVIDDSTDYWDDRVIGHLSDLRYLKGEKKPNLPKPKWKRGTRVRIKGKGINYPSGDFDVISNLEYNQLEPEKGEWTYSLWERNGHWKESELEEVFSDYRISVGDRVKVICGHFRWFTGVVTKFNRDEIDLNGDLVWIQFDVNPRMAGWEDDPDPFTFTFHPYELEKI